LGQKDDKMREIAEKLEHGVEEFLNSDKYKDYLNAMLKFHDYSPANVLLILSQRPDATLVAGYKSWQKNFKRQVRKGEKGIRIIAPAPFKTEVERKVTGADGKEKTEKKEIVIPHFRAATVFDVSQTDGEPLPEIAPEELNGKVVGYSDMMRAMTEISRVPVRFDRIDSGAKGYFSLTEQEIVIRDGMSELQTIKTMIHETVHSELHDPAIIKDPAEKKDRQTMEVEAESTAYMICQYLGLDTSEYSFPYIGSWSSGKDMKELRSSLDLISRTSTSYLDRLSEKIYEITNEKQIRERKKQKGGDAR
jgi:antirestriction protein ArdC